ncbi:ferritin-like domain-containing protein [Zhihengliuella alba]|uniref:Ferritin-like domain-containing protein n=1 Tax=Zhihengliuella alba TaxID=547018 RepID=A0ABP7E055_9MICC
MQIKNSEELFVRLLSLANSAEQQMTKALPKLARAAENPELVEMFEHHLEETEGQLERIDQVASTLDITLKRIKDQSMATLIGDGEEFIEATEKGALRDAALIGAAQRVEHYEIAGYGTLCALAEELGYTEAKNILAETLAEEKSTDEKLSTAAETKINKQA